VQGPGEADAELETPDGETYPLAQARTHEGTAVERSFLVPPATGSWTVTLETSAPTQLNVDLSVDADEPTLTTQATEGDTRPVVAVVDTGVNPYHEVFQAGLSTDELPARIAEEREVLSVPVTPAEDYEASLAHDAGLWHEVPDERLVHFEGTNLLGYQLDGTELPQAPVLDQSGHGTSVAHAVVDEAPNAVVVMITGANYDEGVQWAAEQDWIDLVSLSWGPAVNAAGAAEPYATGFQTPQATQQATDAGKLVFAASGNDPTATITDTTTGPPWVHAVSGAQPDTNGRAAMSGNLVDTVANWTQRLADHDDRQATSNGSGTSFATPRTAGIAAHVLHEVRRAVDHEGGLQDGALATTGNLTVTNHDLRDAMNRSAVYWDTSDYGGPSDPGPSVPVAPTPWASMGWGYLDGSRAEVAIEGLLDGELPDKPAQAEAFMQQHQRSRQAYWSLR
jgi:hypothetical protein